MKVIPSSHYTSLQVLTILHLTCVVNPQVGFRFEGNLQSSQTNNNNNYQTQIKQRLSKIKFEQSSEVSSLTSGVSQNPSFYSRSILNVGRMSKIRFEEIEDSGGLSYFEGSSPPQKGFSFTASQISTVVQPSCGNINGQQTTCQEYIKCAMFHSEYIEIVKIQSGIVGKMKCQLPDGNSGICCKNVMKNREIDLKSILAKSSRNQQHDSDIKSRFESLPTQIYVKNAIDKISKFANQNLEIENKLLLSGKSTVVKKGSSSHGHLLFFQTSKKAIEISRFGYNLLQSSRDISQKLGIVGKGIDEELHKYNLKDTNQKIKCPVEPICNLKFINYRTIDGSCNNLRRPSLGMAFTPLMRILEPDYSDGMWSPRLSKRNLQLPSARLLSDTFIPDHNSPDFRLSLFVMQFGQFVDHDLSHVPVYRYLNGSGIECCTENGYSKLHPSLTHPFCYPIEILPRDSFYKNYGQTCMNFVRSMIAPNSNCSLGYGDQLNQITHWLDNSNVYGSTIENENELRLFRNGLLKTTTATILHGSQHYYHKGMLPLQDGSRRSDECTLPEHGQQQCFNAGDVRVNEMIGLTATHLIWVREHNRIATQLKLINPEWNDNQLYLESKRILNAEYQHILYNEWLPILIGRNYMETYGILPLTTGYSYDYDDKIDSSVSNAFSAAAFRVGHTLIQGILQLINELGIVEEHLYIHKHFNNPFRIREEGLLDKILRTLTREPIQAFDNSVTSEVTRRLFQPSGAPFGMDLIALNIQRGRDHGIPGYNHFREICKIGRVRNFEGFLDWIPINLVQLLSKYFDHVNDVDLFLGGIIEKPFPGSLLGPTFTCIIGDQFARSKKGDRFAYDLGGKESSFTPAQLNSIRRISFARIICDNSDKITKIQPYAFFLPGGDFNQLQSCESRVIPKLNLEPWRV